MNFTDRASTVTGSRSLGWVSIGIGLAELAAPRQVQSLLGLEDRPSHRGILRVLGIRELMQGVSILTEKDPTRQMATSVWSRVAGDWLDKAVLSAAASKTRHPARFAAVSASVVGIGLLDKYFSWQLLQQRRHDDRSWLDSGRAMLAGQRRSILPSTRSAWRALIGHH